jgi:hypothetical protein
MPTVLFCGLTAWKCPGSARTNGLENPGAERTAVRWTNLLADLHSGRSKADSIGRTEYDASRALEGEQPMRHYLRISCTVFGLIALGHLLRLLYRVPAELGQWVVPPGVSVIGFLLPAALAAWAFRLARRVER